MGDRSNIVVTQPDGGRVWLYGHWMGQGSIEVVRNVLSRKERWNDAPYLTRMLFAEMIRGDEEGATGFGISNYMCDNEYPVIVLDCEHKSVWLEDTKEWGTPLSPITKQMSFDDFLYAGSEDGGFAAIIHEMGARGALV